LLTVHLCMYCMSTGVGTVSSGGDRTHLWDGAAT